MPDARCWTDDRMGAYVSIDKKGQIREALGSDPRIVAWLVKLAETKGWKCSGTCTYAVPDGEQTDHGNCPWCVSPLEETIPPRQVNMRELAVMVGVGESKVAIAMKYAERQGFAKRIKGPEQAAWTPTEKAIEAFPSTGQHVVEEPEPVDLGDGMTFKGIPGGPGTSKVFTPGADGWEPATAEGRTLESGEVEVRGELPPGDDPEES